ncbi:MAG: hypothetical protein IJ730_03295, partial [Alphaproteobacteria bacterium]|nr:hypothetical protein [Alphaproteobacteria bacterium]
MILIACFLPIVLAGITYSEKLIRSKDTSLKKTESKNEITKRCAREAALAVAKNWNPGLTLGQQLDGIYKVADAVYNAHPAFSKSTLSFTVPGISLTSDKGASIYANDAGAKQVEYVSSMKYCPRSCISYEYEGSLWNPYYASWFSVDKASDASLRQSTFDEIDENELAEKRFSLIQHEIFQYPCPAITGDYNLSNYPNNNYTFPNCHAHSIVMFTTPRVQTSNDFAYSPKNTTGIGSPPYFVMQTIDSSNLTHQVRMPDSDYVQVMIEKDKIKVRTNDQVGYAVPAKCNLDIVLAIPVNGAACNKDNKDNASRSSGEPYSSSDISFYPSSTAMSTPIYQMGQACKNFIKDNFYHTLGVYMSLIPYSAKISIPPNRVSWTTPLKTFRDSVTDILSLQKMIGACLYSTMGQANEKLVQSNKTYAQISNISLPTADTPYYWGGFLTGYPIMCRQGTASRNFNYADNYAHNGNLLSYTSPNSEESKYMRMNLNPCYMGYASTLSMRCNKTCAGFFPNPYYIIEPTADLVKIYEMCNALYPIADPRNVSNFLFLPLEWAMNFFQSWTNNPQIPKASGSSNYSSSRNSNAVLGRESKTTSGRKKAIIMLVNKPDCFEPGELTYLGFDNDASEFPIADADKIDFSVNFNDTSKKYFDGTSYDGIIRSQKKILTIETIEGDPLSRSSLGYTSTNGTYRLKFPRKGTIKLVVAPPETSYITFYEDNLGSSNDIRRDYIYGPKIPAGTQQTLSPSTTYTYIFKGPSLPYPNTSQDVVNSSQGLSFSHNLCVKKVRYDISGAKITSCTLKDQVVRDYIGQYGRFRGTCDPLIRSNGTVAGRYDSSAAYVPSTASENDYKYYRDSCIEIESSGNPYRYRSINSACYQLNSRYLYVNAWGIAPTSAYDVQVYLAAKKNIGFYSFGRDGSWNGIKGTGSQTGWRSDSVPSTYYTGVNERIRLEFSSVSSSEYDLFMYMIKTPQQKTLSSTTPITVDPLTYEDLTKNRGIYLANYGGQNWICFQGDGELTVQVQSTSGGTKLFQLKNVSGSGSYNTYINEQKTFYIQPSQISNTTDSSGNYYVDFKMQNVNLVSAEITNYPVSFLNEKSMSYNNMYIVDGTTAAEKTESKTEYYYEWEDVVVDEGTGIKNFSQVYSNSNPFLAICYASGVGYCATGGSQGGSHSNQNTIARSSDGSSWKTSKHPYRCDCVIYNNKTSQFCTYGYGGVCFYGGINDTSMKQENLAVGWSSQYAAIITSSYIITAGTKWSSDGKNGTKSKFHNTVNYKDNETKIDFVVFGMAYHDNYISIVGHKNNTGKIGYSSNTGDSFSTISCPTTNCLNAVAYGNGVWVAVGEGGTIVRSTSISSGWSTVSSGTSNTLYAVTYTGSHFVACGDGGKILYSSDGSSWTNASYGSYSYRGVCCKDGSTLMFCTYSGSIIKADGPKYKITERKQVQKSRIVTKTVATTLGFGTRVTSGTYPKQTGQEWKKIGSHYGQTGTKTITKPKITDYSCVKSGCKPFNAICYSSSGGGYCAVGGDQSGGHNNQCTIAWSSSGSSWSTSSHDYRQDCVTYHPGQSEFVSYGYGGSCYYGKMSSSSFSSNNGKFNWVSVHCNVYSNGRMIAGDTNGCVWSFTGRTDWGTTWHKATHGNACHAIAASGSSVVVGSDGGKIAYSTDTGSSWIGASSPTSSKLRGAAYGNSVWVMVGDSGTIVRSTDKSNWSTASSGTSSTLYAVTYTNGWFVACGSSSKVLASSDGGTWYDCSTSLYYNFTGVAANGSTLMFCTSGGSIVKASLGTYTESEPVYGYIDDYGWVPVYTTYYYKYKYGYVSTDAQRAVVCSWTEPKAQAFNSLN